MDALMIARLQFATTTSIHFLFVMVTLGLVTLIVYFQTAWFITKKPVYERLTRFWGQLYVINYVLGIATGIVMEFQFGLNWSGLSHYIGNVFGAPLAMETLVAFFLESTFLGMWIFGWHRLRRGVHLALIWLVALTAYLSAFWVMVANAFLQHPVGYEQRNGIAYLTDFGALLTNPSLWFALGHVIGAVLTAGGFLMAAISSWHFIRRTNEVEFFRKSLRTGLITGTIGAYIAVGFGFAQFAPLSRYQPTKLNADSPEGRTMIADWVARFGPGDYSPPPIVGAAVGFMILIGMALIWAPFVLPLLYRDWFIRLRFPLHLALLVAPFPFIAAILGWITREVGRQPWVAYGLLPIKDAVTPASAGTMLTSYLAFSALLAVLAIADWFLLARIAARGPDVALGRPLDADAPAIAEPALA
jgi:cytochrome d ubiquinol oxidase subunit I